MKVRVVLEKIRILDSHDPALEHVSQMAFDVSVLSDNRDGIQQQTRVPREGGYRPVSGWSVKIQEPIFEGDVDNHLDIRVAVVDADAQEPIAEYTREFSSDPGDWLGHYRPDDAAGPEHLDYWQVFYRIEAAD